MKKRTKITLWSILFVIVFTVSALIRVNMLGSAPMKLMQVKWDDTVGTIYNDLNYENDYGHKYDLYVPANLDIGNAQQLILFIHGGSFNSGAKEDGEVWCKYYASKGYIAASLDYSLQTVQEDASLVRMNTEIKECVNAIKLFQIPCVSLSPYSDMVIFFFGKCQARQIVIALQFIP